MKRKGKSKTTNERAPLSDKYWYERFPIISVQRRNLQRFHSEEEIARLSDKDMADIADKMVDALQNEKVFWRELRLLAKEVLKWA